MAVNDAVPPDPYLLADIRAALLPGTHSDGDPLVNQGAAADRVRSEYQEAAVREIDPGTNNAAFGHVAFGENEDGTARERDEEPHREGARSPAAAACAQQRVVAHQTLQRQHPKPWRPQPDQPAPKRAGPPRPAQRAVQPRIGGELRPHAVLE